MTKKKKFVSLLLLSFFFLLLINSVLAYTIVDNNVIYENEYASLNVFPHTVAPSSPNQTKLIQYFIAEKKIAGTHDLWLAYKFNSPLQSGAIYELVNGEWINRTSYINIYANQDARYYYTNTQLTFTDENPKRIWKIEYEPNENDSSKKWDLLIWKANNVTDIFTDNEDWKVILDPWWDYDWNNTKTITITANADVNSALDSNKTLTLNLDTAALVSAGKLQADCDDLRILYQDNLDMNRVIQGCNQTDTNVFFRVGQINPDWYVVPSGTDTNFSLFYGNGSALAPNIDLNQVFDDASSYYALWRLDGNYQESVSSKDFTATGTPTLDKDEYYWQTNGAYRSYASGYLTKTSLGALAKGTIEALITIGRISSNDITMTAGNEAKRFQFSAGGTTITGLSDTAYATPSNYAVGETHHWAATWDGTTHKVFWDGNQIAERTDAYTLTDGTLSLYSAITGSDSNFITVGVSPYPKTSFNFIPNKPVLTLSSEENAKILKIQYYDAQSGAGIKPDSWIIKGIDYISNCDANGLCTIGDLNGWTTQQYSITATKSGADQNVLQPVFGELQRFEGVGTLTIRRTTIVLVNENNGVALTTADFNGDATKHIKKIIIYDINGNFIYDFNASSTTTYAIDLNNLTSAYNIEITYNNSGLDVTYKKEFNFNYIYDINTRVCIAPLQNFFEQIFTSVQEKKIVVYLPTSNCYSLAANLRNIYQQGQFNNVYTINKTYQAFTTDSDGIKTFLAWVNGGSEYSHDLDAIEFNKQDLEIVVGYDTLAFNPLINAVTNKYDENILQIYWKSYYGKYVSTNLRIFNSDGNVLLYELTEDINANEFTLNWDWNAYNFTDENTLKIIVIGTTVDGTKTTTTQYFNVLGQEYIGTQNPTFIAAMILIFFLFGITLTSIGKTFGWIGIIVCVICMAISVMALPGHYWISLLQAGLFICFLYIILNGGGTQSYSTGAVR